jgi:hypothetical protein
MKSDIKNIVDNELMKQIISARIDTLWHMLSLKKEGKMPKIEFEGATGRYDNKGGIFVPGGIILEDSDETQIEYTKRKFTSQEFRDEIQTAMKFDNATLLYSDGIATGVNLDNGFFARVSKNIMKTKKAAMRRKKTVFPANLSFSSDDVTKSNIPTYIPKPYGSRTRLSSCLSLGLIGAPLYYTLSCDHYNLRKEDKVKFGQNIDNSLKTVVSEDGYNLFAPQIVVCHDIRYFPANQVGLTRMLGIGKFGEFATLSIEEARKSLLNKADEKREHYKDEEIVADYMDKKYVCVIRKYPKTNIGKRVNKFTTSVLSPEKDLGINLEQITEEGKKYYNLK